MPVERLITIISSGFHHNRQLLYPTKGLYTGAPQTNPPITLGLFQTNKQISMPLDRKDA